MKLTKVLEQIKKYGNTFDNECGEKAPKLRSKKGQKSRIPHRKGKIKTAESHMAMQ